VVVAPHIGLAYDKVQNVSSFGEVVRLQVELEVDVVYDDHMAHACMSW
jgi:hypothetical protein